MTSHLAPAEWPVALLPVGLETRFVGDALHIRIFPDEIHVEEHEEGLTAGEIADGQEFWRQVWRGGTEEAAERQAWTQLVAAIGDSRRAAWVVDKTAPRGTPPEQPLGPDEELPEMDFSFPLQRNGVWTRAAVARALPDRFVAIAYRRDGSGGTAGWAQIGTAEGNPVADTIQLGFDPGAQAPEVTPEGPVLPEGMRWMVDPIVAEEVGLLIKLPLPSGTNRVDRLVVLGVLSSIEPGEASKRLSELLAGHHYTRGLELLPIGTPTNNTAAGRSGFASDRQPAESFAIERQTPAPGDNADGMLLARALGIEAGVLRGVAHSGDEEQAAARRMSSLVWPTALGYWFESLIQPGPDDSLIADIRGHAINMVRARGPVPPIRVGRQPYGVLPAMSFSAWSPVAGVEPPGVVALADTLKLLLPWWRFGIAEAPIVRAGSEPEQGILDALGQAPVSDVAGVRSMLGANVSYIPNGVLAEAVGNLPGDEANRQRWLSVLGLQALGYGGFPYIGQLVANADPIPLLHMPYAVDLSRKPDEIEAAWGVVSAYLAGLRTRPTADLRADNPRTFESLLQLLARRSVMLERARVGLRRDDDAVAGKFVEAQLRLDSAPVIDAGLISTTATLRIGETRSVAAALFDSQVTLENGNAGLMHELLDEVLVTSLIDDITDHLDYAATVQAAESVAALQPDRAALLLGEALDVASHRFDAWITSFATHRLADLRRTDPEGVTLGAYGFVEDLARGPIRRPVESPPEGAPAPLVRDPSSAGYVHAPSLGQAATAAVLRAGHLVHAAEDPNSASLAVDLSSSRVRVALRLLDGLRNGQPLGALLGYQAERMLHDLGAHAAVEDMRELAPPPVVPAQETPEGLAPRAVCDGLALSRMDPDVVRGAVDPAHRPAVDAVLKALDDSVDAVADLLLAEGVHQIVRGNPERTSAALDTLNRGDGAVIEPEVIRTPRAGTTVTHRILVAIGKEAASAPGWPVNGVRAQAEPRLAAWVGALLGDPSGLTVTARASDNSASFPFGDLGLGALDLAYEQLEARAQRNGRRLGLSGPVTVDMSERRLAGMLEMAELVRNLLLRARLGTGHDLVRSQDRGSIIIGPPPTGDASTGGDSLTTTLPDVDAGDLRNRLTAARQQLSDALASLDDVLDDEQSELDELELAPTLDTLAGFGLTPGGDASRPPTVTDVTALAESTRQRLRSSEQAPDDPRMLFGEGFHMLPLVAPPASTNLTNALSVDPIAPIPDAELASLGGRRQAIASWIETYGRVRSGVGRLADVLLAARLVGSGAAVALRAAQLPVEPFPDADPGRRGQWVGLTFPASLGAEPVTSFVMTTHDSIDANAGMAVLVVDEFVEVVPAALTTTAVSFGFNAPGSRPPQSILLAVPAVVGTPWTADLLADVVNETVDLAKIRMVDLSTVAWAGRFIPALYFTDGDLDSGVDLPFKDLVQIASEQFRMIHS